MNVLKVLKNKTKLTKLSVECLPWHIFPRMFEQLSPNTSKGLLLSLEIKNLAQVAPKGFSLKFVFRKSNNKSLKKPL